MKVSLGVWNLDALLFERLADHEVEFAPEHTGCGGVLFGPDTEHEIEGAIAELLQQRVRFRVLQHTGMLIGNLKEKPADKLRIRSIRYPDRKIESHVPVGVTPIGHYGGDELGIRNDDGDVVVGDNRSGPQCDIDDIAGDRADFDAIADFDGAFDEKEEPADEIIGDVLQAEADPDAEGSGQDRHGTQVDTGRLENYDQADGNDDVADDHADRQSDSQLHAASGEESCDDPNLQPAGNGEEEKNENDEYNERPKRDGRLGGREDGDIEKGFDPNE